MLEYPKATAPATAKPKVADFPLPLAAVRDTVVLNVFSEIASIIFSSDLAWNYSMQHLTNLSNQCSYLNFKLFKFFFWFEMMFTWSIVLQQFTRPKTGSVPLKLSFKAFSSSRSIETVPFWTRSIFKFWEEIGRTRSWSSITRLLLQEASDKMKRSLNLQTTSWWDSVRYLLWTSMCIVYNCFRELTFCSKKTMIPPPSTVSIVRANKSGVSASKSCQRENWNVTNLNLKIQKQSTFVFYIFCNINVSISEIKFERTCKIHIP